MIILPSGPRRKWLISFWLAISLVSGALCGAMFALLIAPRWFVLGGIVTLVMAAPGLRRPQAAARPYQRWRRAARGYCRVACRVLTGLCFCTVFVVARVAGSSLGLALARPRPTRTMWTPRITHAPTAYAYQYNRAAPGSPRAGWLRPYLSWTVRSGHVWAVGLLPFLIMLKILEPGQEKGAPANIYTLF
jgi:hypothetical protein